MRCHPYPHAHAHPSRLLSRHTSLDHGTAVSTRHDQTQTRDPAYSTIKTVLPRSSGVHQYQALTLTPLSPLPSLPSSSPSSCPHRHLALRYTFTLYLALTVASSLPSVLPSPSPLPSLLILRLSLTHSRGPRQWSSMGTRNMTIAVKTLVERGQIGHVDLVLDRRACAQVRCG